jgi:nucleoid-associated protein YgaU
MNCPRIRIMTATSLGRIAAPVLALVAAGSAALVGFTQVRREPPVETTAIASEPAIAAPATGHRDNGSVLPATPQAEANAAAEALSIPPPPSRIDDSVPVFDVARIEPTGDAVIAGRAAPGATVELLRNGERHDRAVADQYGQFVMVPSKLPPGKYELSLRSIQPDGKQAISNRTVAVALEAAQPTSGASPLRAEAPLDVPNAVVTSHPGLDKALSSQAHALPREGSSSTVVVPKAATTVVSRGDSLWRISRFTYGSGMRYAVVYKANRNQIANPDRIYPGQIFVLPANGR